MQPEQDNNEIPAPIDLSQDNATNVPPVEPLTNTVVGQAPISQPTQTTQPIQPTQAQQPAQSAPLPTSPHSQDGYINQLKAIIHNPKNYFDNTSEHLKKSVIFMIINLGTMSSVTLATSLINVLLEKNFSGDYLWELVKGVGFCALYTSAFLFAISGIVMIISLIAKKDAKFSGVFSVMSVFSLNFITVSIASIVFMLLGWVNSSDLSNIVVVILNIITSLAFIYTCSLIIHGISSTTKFNLFKSTAIYIVSAILLIFIFGKIIKTFPYHFNLSFGQYSGYSPTGFTRNSYDNMLDSILDGYR